MVDTIGLVTQIAYGLNQISEDKTSLYLPIPLDKLGPVQDIISYINKGFKFDENLSPYYAMRAKPSANEDPQIKKIVTIQLGKYVFSEGVENLALFYGGEIIPVFYDKKSKQLYVSMTPPGSDEPEQFPLTLVDQGPEQGPKYATVSLTLDVYLPLSEGEEPTLIPIEFSGSIAWASYSKDSPNPNSQGIMTLIKKGDLMTKFLPLLKDLTPGDPQGEARVIGGKFESNPFVNFREVEIGTEFEVKSLRQGVSKGSPYAIFTVQDDKGNAYSLSAVSYPSLLAFRQLLPIRIKLTDAKVSERDARYMDISLAVESVHGQEPKWVDIPQWGSKAPEVLPSNVPATYPILGLGVKANSVTNASSKKVFILLDPEESGDYKIVALTGASGAKDVFLDTEIGPEAAIIYRKIGWQGETKSKQDVKADIKGLIYPMVKMDSISCLMGEQVPETAAP
jgi:hypothetical protein